MEILIQVQTGFFLIAGVRIRQGTSFNLVQSSGLIPIDINTLPKEAKYCRYGKNELWNEDVYIGMTFNRDLLEKISLGFPDIDGLKPFDVHRNFLDRNLRILPEVFPNREALYRYSWGEFAVRRDVKTDISGIEVTWN